VRISDDNADHSAVAGVTAAVSTVAGAAVADASVTDATVGATAGWAAIMSVGVSVTMVLSDCPASSCADMLR
jgi:hypothetical protein